MHYKIVPHSVVYHKILLAEKIIDETLCLNQIVIM